MSRDADGELETPRITYKSVSLITDCMTLSSLLLVDEGRVSLGEGVVAVEELEQEEDVDVVESKDEEDELDDSDFADNKGDSGGDEAGVSNGLVTSLVGSATQVKYFRS